MRNALGLLLASFVTAAVISGVWYWTSTPRVELAAPATVAVPLPARFDAANPPNPLAAAENAEFTAAVPAKPEPAACANADALGLARVVVIAASGRPGFG